MRLKLENILANGYFVKELPPPFNTQILGRKSDGIRKKITKPILKAFSSSECIRYSIPKPGFGRRILGIPNPLHYLILCQSLDENWSKIEKIYKESTYSTSRPLIDTDGLSNHGTKNFEKFKKNRLMYSGKNTYELKTDISRYYSTIYTHIIPWAIYGRAYAKANRRKLLWGNELDRNVRNLQAQQTMGIPVGPEASAIIAELIGCRLDKAIKGVVPHVKGFRYIDDYYFYFSDEATPEKVLRNLQFKLGQYQLELNEEKTVVTKFPFGLESEWVLALRSFKFRDSVSEQENDVRDFFSMAFRFAIQFPKEPVLKYALTKFENLKIDKKNWPYLEAWVLKATLHQPTILEETTRLFLLNQKFLSLTKIRAAIEELVKIHALQNNSFEMTWALWLAKSLEIKIGARYIKAVFFSGDAMATLVALDLRASKLVDGYVSVRPLNSDLTEDSLFSTKWLLTYEAVVQKWLKPANSNLLSKNQFFRILIQNKVSFYDSSRQIAVQRFGEADHSDSRTRGKKGEKLDEVRFGKSAYGDTTIFPMLFYGD